MTALPWRGLQCGVTGRERRAWSEGAWWSTPVAGPGTRTGSPPHGREFLTREGLPRTLVLLASQRGKARRLVS